MPNGYNMRGFCSQIAVFRRVRRRKARCEGSGTFNVLRHCVVPTKFLTDFNYKFFNDLLYSVNLTRSWMELDYGDGVPVEEVYKVPSISIMCDGSLARFREMIGKIQEIYRDKIRVEDDCVFVKYSGENSDEDD